MSTNDDAIRRNNMDALIRVLRDVKIAKGDRLVRNDESESLFRAYNRPHDPDVAHEPRLEIYGVDELTVTHGYFETELLGRVPVTSPSGTNGVDDSAPPKVDTRRPVMNADGTYQTMVRKLRIAYTVMSSVASRSRADVPVWLFSHGVPMNRRMKFPLMRKMARHVKCVAFDLLGMGQSDMPLDFPWSWDIHAAYIPSMVEHILESELALPRAFPIFYQSDDWGSGPHMKVAELSWAREHIAANVVLHPIAFSGYFISEIGAVGRASALPWPVEQGELDVFALAMGALDQSLVQIEKSMVGDAHDVTNQWQQRDDLLAYVETDYERNDSRAVMRKSSSDLVGLMQLMDVRTQDVYTPRSRQLRMWNIRVFSQQAGMLRPASLTCYGGADNPQGVQFDRIAANTREFMVGWNEGDSMMPENQRFHYQNAMRGARVRILRVEGKGHFAEKSAVPFLAASYIEYTQEVSGLTSVAQPFLGLDGQHDHKWKGDEAERHADLTRLYWSPKRQERRK